MSVASPKRKPRRAKPTANPWPELLRNLRAEVGRREKLGRSLHQAEAAEQLARTAWERSHDKLLDARQNLTRLKNEKSEA